MSAFSESDHHRFSDSAPFFLWSVKKVEYHFFSDTSPKNDQRPGGNLFANIDKCGISISLCSDLHKMSLNIDMKIIRLVVNPGKIFNSSSIGSPSIVSKVLYCDELLNQLNFSSHAEFDVKF